VQGNIPHGVFELYQEPLRNNSSPINILGERRFRLHNVGSGLYNLIAETNGLVIEVDDSPQLKFAYYTGSPRQKWSLLSNSSSRIVFQNFGTFHTLEVNNASNSAVLQDALNGTTNRLLALANQPTYLTAKRLLLTGTYQIQPKGEPSQLLRVESNSMNAGARIQLSEDISSNPTFTYFYMDQLDPEQSLFTITTVNSNLTITRATL
jgi:hypothetical protein